MKWSIGRSGKHQFFYILSRSPELQDALDEHVVLRYRLAKDGGFWKPSKFVSGAALRQPGPLFKKLEERIAEEDRTKLGN